MIFLGDLVFPISFKDSIIKISDIEFLYENKVANFEALIDINNCLQKKNTKGIALYSSEDLIPFCKNLNIVAGSLANNHITDFDVSIRKQREFYEKEGIITFGAGDNLDEASQPFFYEEGGNKYIVIAFGWKVIGCKSAGVSLSGVNPLDPKNIFNQVRYLRKNYPDHKIILIFHWNYEFELYPQPAHRQLAFDLIDEGVEAIFGHHSHIVQGFEIYKNKPIFYGLGNFYLPEKYFFGKDKWTQYSKLGISVKYVPDPGQIKVFWTQQESDGAIKLLNSGLLFNSKRLLELSVFQGRNHLEYSKWFKTHRKRRSLLPIYYSYNNKMESFIKDKYNFYRQHCIYLLLKLFKKL